MAVDVGPGENFTNGTARVLFTGIRLLPVDSGLTYDISPDGKSLITTLSSAGVESLTSIEVVLNFFNDVKEITGAGR